MTQPTQAQIEAFRRVMPTWWQRGAAQKKEETEEIRRCLAAAAAPAEVDDTEWTCADCDHVQRGHRFHCEKCGRNYGTVAAAEVETPYKRELRLTSELRSAAEVGVNKVPAIAYCAYDGPQDQVSAAIAATIERCAQVADSLGQHGVGRRIRALKDQ